MRATLSCTGPMTAFRPRTWAKPIISVAAAGLGAAVAGPLGGALGGWIGDAIGGSTCKLLENFSKKFGEKAAENLLDVGGDFLAEKLKPASAPLERVYREALRQSLQKIEPQLTVQDFADWFAHWDRRLAAAEPLDLSFIGSAEADRADLLWQILVSLDAEGKAMGEKEPQIVERRREMPEALEAALSARLPEAVRATFNALIVKPEYEAAWKQAERAFQDVLELTVADIGKTTRQIHRNTKQLREDSKAIRKTLASIAREPNAPLLGLSASESGKRWIMPYARDKDASLGEAIIAEARRMGVPDGKWVSKALAALRKRIKEARQTLERGVKPDQWDLESWMREGDVGAPIDESETYAVKVEEWYRIATFQLSERQEYETFAARSMFLTMTISNTGRAPADKVTVELVFPEVLSVDETRHEPASVPESPEIPVSLKQEVEETFPRSDLRPFSFYPGWPLPRLCWERLGPGRIEFFRKKCDGDSRQIFSAHTLGLEHGMSRVSRPLRLSFGFGPCRDLTIKYRLHANNQPVDSVGEIHIQAVETTKPPKV